VTTHPLSVVDVECASVSCARLDGIDYAMDWLAREATPKVMRE